MKSTIVRAFVVALAITGTFAYTHTATATVATISPAHTSSLPVPSCDPSDPTCGLGE